MNSVNLLDEPIVRWEVAMVYDASRRLVLTPPGGTALLTDWVARYGDASPDTFGRYPSLMVTRMDAVNPGAQRMAAHKGRPRPGIVRDWDDILAADRKVERIEHKVDKDGNVECKTCGARWYHKAEDYDLVHVCGKGLVSVA